MIESRAATTCVLQSCGLIPITNVENGCLGLDPPLLSLCTARTFYRHLRGKVCCTPAGKGTFAEDFHIERCSFSSHLSTLNRPA